MFYVVLYNELIIDYHRQALIGDGWNTEPFKLVVDEKSGQLIGRGSSDDKGPVLGWINILEAHKRLGLPLPVNLKFCFEGMEESGSEGLDELIASEVGKGKFFEGVDAVCIVSVSSFCVSPPKK
jgi:Cys-Gly metallodipeptidase DUG1